MVHGKTVILQSAGVGATIDAQGASRHFDVAYGGALHLDAVHLINGGRVHTGAAVLVRHGGKLSTSNSIISDCVASSSTRDPRGGAIAVDREVETAELASMNAHIRGGPVAWSPSGTIIATSSGGEIKIFDALSLRELAAQNVTDDQVKSLAFSPDGVMLVSAGGSGTIRVWRWDGDAPALIEDAKRDLAHESRASQHAAFRGVNAVAFTPDGSHVISGGGDNYLRVWTSNLTQIVVESNASAHPQSGIRSLAVSPGGRVASAKIATIGHYILKVWELQLVSISLTTLHSVGDGSAVNFTSNSLSGYDLSSPLNENVAFAPPLGDDLVFADQSHMIRFRVSSVGVLNEVVSQAQGADALSFSNDGTTITAVHGSTLRIVQASSMHSLIKTDLGTSFSTASSLATSASNSWATTLVDGKLQLWDVDVNRMQSMASILSEVALTDTAIFRCSALGLGRQSVRLPLARCH